MSDFRIKEHPILSVHGEALVPFSWKGQGYKARQGETIASALFANGIRVFGHHHNFFEETVQAAFDGEQFYQAF